MQTQTTQATTLPPTDLAWTPASTITAWRLAHAHDHGWAATPIDPLGCERPVAQLLTDGSLDLAATEIAQRAYEGNGMGIAGLRPSLSHSTTTGRTRWVVTPDGQAEITICRPGNRHVVCGEVAPDDPRLYIYVDTEDCEARHVVAFVRAMLVVIGCGSLSSLVFWTDPTCGGRQVPTITCDGVDFPWPDLAHLRGARDLTQACETALELAAFRWLGSLDLAAAEQPEQDD
jgi:hypothetical protein